MKDRAFDQQQKQLELDRRALELDRQGFQLESKKKSFQLKMQQQKSQFEQQKLQFEQQKAQFEQQVQSLHQREQSLNTRFNHIEQTLLDISSTPLLLQQPQQHQAEQHSEERHVEQQYEEQQHEEQQHEEQREEQQALSSPSSPSSLPSLSSHDNNQQSIIPLVPNFDMMINIYDQHLTTLAKTLKTTARKLAKKEIELNEMVEQYNLFPPEVGKLKSSQIVVQQATQCAKCEKCDKISELDRRELEVEKAEGRVNERKATLDKGEADLRQREHDVHTTQKREMSQSDCGRMVECFAAIKQDTQCWSIPSLDPASPRWEWISSCNQFCWMMYAKRCEIKSCSIRVTFVRDDDRSYRCQYPFGWSSLFSSRGNLDFFIKDNLQEHYTNPITKLSFSTPLINNGEWFTVEGRDLGLQIYFVSPQDVKMGLNVDPKTLYNVDATEYEILFKAE